jgi:hypothetical protein
MNLDESQKLKVTQWIADGLKLAEIQNRLQQEYGLRLTYMEVRFVVDDLKLTPKDPEPPAPVAPVPPAAPAAPAAPGVPAVPPIPATAPKLAPLEPAPGAGKLAITADAIARPGTLVSGQVTFSDGEAGDWYLDQAGRLGVAPKTKGYRPSPADVQDFQAELETVLARLGM